MSSRWGMPDQHKALIDAGASFEYRMNWLNRTLDEWDQRPPINTYPETLETWISKADTPEERRLRKAYAFPFLYPYATARIALIKEVLPCST